MSNHAIACNHKLQAQAFGPTNSCDKFNFPFILVLCINKMSSASFWFLCNSSVLRINYEKLPLHLKI